MSNVFQNPTKSVPKSDPQIVRVDFAQSDIAGRKDHIGSASKSGEMAIRHVPKS